MTKSRSVTILLALFMGGIGAHRFYLGEPGAGILYLLFCWTLIPSLVALVDIIGYLKMSNEAFEERYH